MQSLAKIYRIFISTKDAMFSSDFGSNLDHVTLRWGLGYG